MTKGQVVTVLLYGGSTAERRVIAEKGDVVVVCAEEEFRAAERECREPSGVGFPRQDVLIPDPPRKEVGRIRGDQHRGSLAGD